MNRVSGEILLFADSQRSVGVRMGVRRPCHGGVPPNAYRQRNSRGKIIR
jgi:hypothetical protein